MKERFVTFTFKQFSVDDSRCGMKIGTDGVTIGAWANYADAATIADIGCGCGIISLMAAQRSNAQIIAIEIDEGAALDARANFDASPWADRIVLYKSDFDKLQLDCAIDLIISNPPFFSSGENAPDANRALARHEGSLNYLTLIDFASQNLSSDGRLAFVYPYGNDDAIIYHAEMKHLKLRRICHVRQRKSRPFVRTLYEFCRKDGAITKQELTISEPNGSYTKEYKELTKDFYLCC